MDPGAGLIQHIDGLVGHELIGYIAVAEFDAAFNGFIGVAHLMVALIVFFESHQNELAVLNGGRCDNHLLETSFQGAVFFDVAAVFIQGGGADDLDFTPGQGRLEHIGRIQ